jgi:MraZ protein
MTIDPPDLPTPIIADNATSKPATENKDKPAIVAAVETPPSPPPDLPVADPVETTKGKKAPASTPDVKTEDSPSPLPPDTSVAENSDREIAKPGPRPAPSGDIVTVAAEQPAKTDKGDLPPIDSPPPPADVKNPPLPTSTQMEEDPKPAPKRELTTTPDRLQKDAPGKPSSGPSGDPTSAPSTLVPPPDGPLRSTYAPPDIAPPPSVKPSTPEPPVSTPPMPVDPPPSVNPRIAQPERDTPPPARIVPVSPTTPESVKVTPVIKKPAGKSKMLPMTGTHACKMDRDHGVTLPREARDQLGEQEVLFVTLGTDHAVWITTAAGLEKLADRLEKTPDVDDETKVTRRRYFAQTERVAVDKSGHFVLPAALADSAGLKQDAVLIGVGDHLELWDAQRWQKVSQTIGGAETPDAPASDSHEEL